MKRQRRDFALAYEKHNPSKTLYLDDTGMNLHTVLFRSWSKAGVTPTITTPNSKGQNITVTVMISMGGVVDHMIIDGALNSDKMCSFFNGMGERALNGYTIIVDNLGVHKCPEVFYRHLSNMK